MPADLRPSSGVTVYLESRYRKLERGLPQTIFYCPECRGHRRRRRRCERCGGFGKLFKDSVQELIARHVLPAFGARKGKFHGAGREDVDVLMLGEGRPFVFEVCAAAEAEVDLVALLERIHARDGDRIRLAPWQRVGVERVAFWKQSQFDKVYRAEVALGEAIGSAAVEALVGRRLQLAQRTPQRVAHRRADLLRERQVTVLATAQPAPDRIAVDLRCEHGTYVKEWVSGDGGRTRPSLADLLGVPCVCCQLDVLEIVSGEDDGR